jgi:imidazole glycerol-phosphate synthase subunit HisH
MLTIIDYGIGNLSSIKNMLKKVGLTDCVISKEVADIERADKLILPGVGHFDYGMRQLRAAPFFDALNQRVLHDKVPVLGICLGAQLLTKSSEEGEEQGLGWIDAQTVRFDSQKMPSALKVPHMGWSDVQFNPKSKLFDGVEEVPRFYFVHTFHLVCNDPTDAAVQCNYGYEFTAGIERGNILGMQFHPEKSHRFGMKIVENYIKNY